MKLAVVTATLDPVRAAPCIESWKATAGADVRVYLLLQSAAEQITIPFGAPGLYTVLHRREILGVVPAFAIGVQRALEEGAEIIACLHDDLLIEETGWDQEVLDLFNLLPEMGLCGFGGALGLGDADIYQTPYHPMQLARQTFLSNMRHAEAHGQRETRFRWISCLDGFSQIGRREFWLQDRLIGNLISPLVDRPGNNLFDVMASWGLVHHAYDAALGCFAKRLGWRVGLVPIACHHFGGQTAVADPRYTNWAREQFSSITHDGQQVQGDAACWTHAHREVYERFRDVLPLRVP